MKTFQNTSSSLSPTLMTSLTPYRLDTTFDQIDAAQRLPRIPVIDLVRTVGDPAPVGG